MVRLVDYSSSSGSGSDSDASASSSRSWRSFGAPPSDSDASSAAMDLRSPPPTPPVAASPRVERVSGRGTRDEPFEVDAPQRRAPAGFSRAAGDPARLRSAFADSPFRRKSARVVAGDGSAASPMEISDDEPQSENVMDQPRADGFERQSSAQDAGRQRREPLRKHRAATTTLFGRGGGGQSGGNAAQTGAASTPFRFGDARGMPAQPAFVFGKSAAKPAFSFGAAPPNGSAAAAAAGEGWRDRAAPPTQTNAFFRATSDFVAGSAASSQPARFSFRPSTSTAAATQPTKKRDFTFGAPHTRQTKAAEDPPPPPPPRKSVSEAFEEINGSPGFSTGVSYSSSRAGHRNRRRRTTPSAPQTSAPATQSSGPAAQPARIPSPPAQPTAPAASSSSFDFSTKTNSRSFKGYSGMNQPAEVGSGAAAATEQFSFGRANRFAGVAGDAGVKTTAAFTFANSESSKSTTAGEASSSAPPPPIKSSIFSWGSSLPTGQATGTTNNPASFASTQETSPFAFRYQFGRRESSTGQPVVDNLKNNFGDFSIGSAGTPRKQGRLRRRSGLFSGRSTTDESNQSSQSSQTGSPFGLGASTSSTTRERQQVRTNPPADMFATPIFQAVKPNSTPANPPARFLRRTTTRRNARSSLAARQVSTFGAFNSSVDQNDAEMDSSEDESDWRELKRLGGEAHLAQKYFEATEFYRQSIDALDYYLDRFPDLRTDGLTNDKAKLHANRAASLMMLMQITEAQRECRVSIEIDPGYTRAYLRLARIQVMLGELADAKCNLSIAKRLIADDVRNKRNVTNSSADQLDITKTEESIRKLSALQGEIKWCLDVGDLRQGLAHVEVALGLAPSCRTLQMQKARILLDQKNYEKVDRYCNDLLQKLRSVDRKDNDVSNSSAVDTKELREVARIGVELALLWATALHYHNKVDDAMRILTSLEVAAPSSVKVVQLKRQWIDMQEAKQQANELFKRGEFQRAIPLYSQALCLDPKHDEYCAVIYCNRAAALMNLERYHTALVDCDEALQRKPQYPRALLRRARCYMALKRYSEAVSSFNQYLQAHGRSLAPDVVLAVERERNEAKAAIAKEAEERRRARQAKKQAEQDQRNRRARGGEQRRAWEGNPFYDSYRRSSGFFAGRSSSSGDNPKRASFMAPKTQRRTHYDVLGISSQATAEDIKKAYRRLALVYHPDKSSAAGHEELFKEMTAAYTVLSDASARAKYDRELVYHRFGNFYEN